MKFFSPPCFLFTINFFPFKLLVIGSTLSQKICKVKQCWALVIEEPETGYCIRASAGLWHLLYTVSWHNVNSSKRIVGKSISAAEGLFHRYNGNAILLAH